MVLLISRKTTLLHNILRSSLQLQAFTRTTSSANPRASEAVFLEKSLEDPVIVVCEQDDVDIIGPPHPISNLRPVIRKRLISETAPQKKLREMYDATHDWNQAFWTKHNTNFIKLRQEYIESHQVEGQEKKQLTADEMSEFYKEFLDNNWEAHVRYNMEWYKRNFTLMFWALRVNVEKNIAKIL